MSSSVFLLQEKAFIRFESLFVACHSDTSSVSMATQEVRRRESAKSYIESRTYSISKRDISCLALKELMLCFTHGHRECMSCSYARLIRRSASLYL